MRVLVIVTLLVALAAAAVPTAQADHVCVGKVGACLQDPQCIQVYPWSRLCSGDVIGFLEAILEDHGAVLEPSPLLP